jgi:hypothetical protein
VQIGEIALAPDRAFVSLGTATVALNRSGSREWRVAGPGGPAAADATWLLTHHVRADAVQVSLRSIRTGGLEWTTEYPPADPGTSKPPGGGGPPPPGGDNGPGPNGPESDEDWYRTEGLLTPSHAVLREVRNIRVLDLADGGTMWQHTSPTPVVSVQVVGDLVLIGADRLNALSLGSGALRWQVNQRGARVAGTPDGRLVIAASEDGVTAFDADGATRWRTEIPLGFADGMVDRVTTDVHHAFVTFKARGDRRDPLDVDVLVIALDDQAVRPVP